MSLCAPFTVTRHNGQDWITRDGQRQRIAPVEVSHLLNGGQLENDIHYELMGWGEVWSFSGGWYDDPDKILSVVGVLRLRAERLMKQQEGSGEDEPAG